MVTRAFITARVRRREGRRSDDALTNDYLGVEKAVENVQKLGKMIIEVGDELAACCPRRLASALVERLRCHSTEGSRRFHDSTGRNR